MIEQIACHFEIHNWIPAYPNSPIRNENKKLMLKLNLAFLHDMISLKNRILKELSDGCQNIFVFMQAFPLVQHDSNRRIIPLRDFANFKLNTKPKLIEAFKETDREVFIKFDYLNRHSLRKIIAKGCRVLQLGLSYFNTPPQLAGCTPQ